MFHILPMCVHLDGKKIPKAVLSCPFFLVISQVLRSPSDCSFLLSNPQSTSTVYMTPFFHTISGLPCPPSLPYSPSNILCHVDHKQKGSFPQMSRSMISNSYTSNKCLKLDIL